MKLLITFILGAALAWPQIIVLPKKKATGSVAVDANASGITPNTTSTTCSFSITVGAGSNRAIVAFLSASNNAISSITADVGATSMSAISGADSGAAVSKRSLAFGVAAPSSGAQTVAFSWTGNSAATCGAVTFTGVDQSTPFDNGTFASGGAANAGLASVSITSTAGSMTVDGFYINLGTAPDGYTQTLQLSRYNNSAFSTNIGISTGPGTGTTTHSWTDPGGYKAWALSGVNVRAQ